MSSSCYVIVCGHCAQPTSLAAYAKAQQRSTRASSAARAFVQRASCTGCREKFAAPRMRLTLCGVAEYEAGAALVHGKRRRLWHGTTMNERTQID